MSYALTFDGHDIGAAYAVERHATRTLSSWEPNLVDVAGRIGALYAGTRALPAQVTVDIYALGSTREARQAEMRTLADWLAVDEPKTLTLGDEEVNSVQLTRKAIPTGESMQEAYLSADHAEVTFVCPDPRLYGATGVVGRINAQNGATISVTVGGTAPTEPMLAGTATGNSAGLWKLVDETGAGIYYAIPDGTSYAFVADCANRTLTLNGNTVMLPPTYDWMSWEPGAHTLTMTGGVSTINVSWPTRWW